MTDAQQRPISSWQSYEPHVSIDSICHTSCRHFAPDWNISANICWMAWKDLLVSKTGSISCWRKLRDVISAWCKSSYTCNGEWISWSSSMTVGTFLEILYLSVLFVLVVMYCFVLFRVKRVQPFIHTVKIIRFRGTWFYKWRSVNASHVALLFLGKQLLRAVTNNYLWNTLICH